MARPATGSILEHHTKRGEMTRSLRFRCLDGTRHTEPLGVVTRDEAETKLRHRMADVECGWKPAKRVQRHPERMPSFHEFAAEWWTLHELEWAPKTVTDYRWRLEEHLLGHFEKTPLDEIDYAAVERYIADKRRQGLSPRSVNMTVTLMASILEVAVERELIARNPAKGRGRRVRERQPRAKLHRLGRGRCRPAQGC